MRHVSYRPLDRFTFEQWKIIIVKILIVLSFTVFLAYHVFTSTWFVNQMMKEKLPLSRPERAHYCSQGVPFGVCGRPSTWPCSLSNQEDLIDIIEGSFFLETSYKSSLNYRQACSVESLAKLNPNLTVHVLMISEEIDRTSSTFVALTENYSNVRITHLNIADLVAGSEMEQWYYCSGWNKGWYPIPHLSDALRFFILKKFGGYYFDLDVIQLRPIDGRLRNFAAVQDEESIAIGALHFDKGHPLIEDVVKSFPIDYKWFRWSYAGVALLTRSLQKFCQENEISSMTIEKCKGFRVLHSKSFYPIRYQNWVEYFQDGADDNNYLVDDGDVIGVHVWNYLSSDYKVKKHSNQLFVQLARKSCPRVLAVAPQEF